MSIAFIRKKIRWGVTAHQGIKGIQKGHVAGLSLGAATGMWLAAKYPEKVKSLSLHSGWTKTDPFLKVVEEGWQVMAHDAESQLRKIEAPTHITFGRYDMVTSTRFADPMRQNIQHAELVIFEGCSHAPIYEKVDEFN